MSSASQHRCRAPAGKRAGWPPPEPDWSCCWPWRAVCPAAGLEPCRSWKPISTSPAVSSFVGNHLLLALLTAGLVTTPALLLAYASAGMPSLPTRLAVRLATLGAAVPGTVLAVGVTVPVARLDNQLLNRTHLARRADGHDPGEPWPSCCWHWLRAAAWESFSAVDDRHGTHPQKPRKSRPGCLGMRGLPLRRNITCRNCATFADNPADGAGRHHEEMPITLMTRQSAWDTLAVPFSK